GLPAPAVRMIWPPSSRFAEIKLRTLAFELLLITPPTLLIGELSISKPISLPNGVSPLWSAASVPEISVPMKLPVIVLLPLMEVFMPALGPGIARFGLTKRLIARPLTVVGPD